MHMISVMGPTNSGKSTLLSAAGELDGVGLIEVGKELRRRHPPEYFNGMAAMKHTEKEVWQIFDEQYQRARDRGCAVVVVDGQPRMEEQVERTVLYARNCSFSVLLLHSDLETLRSRARKRDAACQRSLELSMLRLTNDYVQLLPVLGSLLGHKDSITDSICLDTALDDWLPLALSFITNHIPS